jgi:hypothetical protein
MPSVIYAECHIQALNAECHYGECLFAEYHFADFRDAECLYAYTLA